MRHYAPPYFLILNHYRLLHAEIAVQDSIAIHPACRHPPWDLDGSWEGWGLQAFTLQATVQLLMLLGESGVISGNRTSEPKGRDI